MSFYASSVNIWQRQRVKSLLHYSPGLRQKDILIQVQGIPVGHAGDKITYGTVIPDGIGIRSGYVPGQPVFKKILIQFPHDLHGLDKIIVHLVGLVDIFIQKCLN